MIYVVRVIVIVIVLSVLIHVFTILTLPFFAENKSWNAVTGLDADRRFQQLSNFEAAVATLGQADPAMRYAVCHFNLEDADVSVQADRVASFWNVSVFNQQGEMLYSLHDGATRDGDLNLILRNRGVETQRLLDEAAGIFPDVTPLNEGELPAPRLRPLALDNQVEDPEATHVESDAVLAILDVGPSFLVLKMLRQSPAYERSVALAMAEATCE